LNGAEIWTVGTVHRIIADLTIGSEDTLIIEHGTWVMLDSAVNIIVDGYFHVQGTGAYPVSFIPYSNTSDWGGIIINTGTAVLQYALATGGGGDASYSYGHSESQATIMSTGGDVEMNHCFIFDCSGKGIGADNGIIQFKNGAISRCDMGGDFVGSYSQISSSHILDTPNDDGQFVDDDNDGFYFSGTHSSVQLPSTIDSCVFIIGKDDGIDHNAAVLEIKHSWIEGFENEGIAASNGNSLFVYNTLISDCEQGIEAGYGTPEVTVDHCVMIDNDYGLRFGDWYNLGCNGSIVCTNSIMYNNGDNIHNFDVLSNGPVTGAMDITYCLTNDIEYDNGIGCLTGIPAFNSTYYLDSGSIGSSSGNDGLDMGLISPIGVGTNNLRNDAVCGDLLTVEIYDTSGRQILKSRKNLKEIQSFSELRFGIYIVVQYFENGIHTFKHLIER
jgi:hypothetical protein